MKKVIGVVRKDQTISLFKEAWNDFKKYFDTKCKRYSAGMEKEDANLIGFVGPNSI